MAAVPDEVMSQQEPLPPEYYVPHNLVICVNSNDPGMAKPFYITSSFDNYHECCAEASPDVMQCLDAAPDDIEEYNPPGISDTIIEISMFGSVSLQLSAIPKYNSPEWSTLKRVLTNTITAVMLESHLANQGIVVKLLTFAGKRLRPQRSQMESLEFEMTIPVRCNAMCQLANKNGPLGKVASNELEEHWAWYVDTGAFSSFLWDIGEKSGLFSKTETPPSAKLGKLT